MKNVLLLLLFSLFLTSEILAQEQREPLVINSDTLIKKPDGSIVASSDIMEILESGEWNIKPTTAADGTSYLQLIKLTEAEKEIIKTQPKQPMPPSKLKGEPMPYFNIADLEGNVINTENTKGKVVVFNFWFASCPPCIQEIPELNDVYEKYKNNDAVVFAAVTFEQEEKIAQFQEKYNFKYPIIGNEITFSQKITKGGYPTNVVVKKDGAIQEHIMGGMTGIGTLIETAIIAALK